METEGSLPGWQVPATCLYPEPDQSSPCPPIQICDDPFKYYLPLYAWVFQVVSIPQVSPPKSCLHLSSPHTCYMPCLSCSSRFNHPNNILWGIQLPQQTIRMFTHPNIHQSRTSPDVKTHNQIDHILTNRILRSSIRDVRHFRGAECDKVHCLVFPKVRERFVVSKQETQMLNVERFNLR
jgi:hypothetical protein